MRFKRFLGSLWVLYKVVIQNAVSDLENRFFRYFFPI